MSKSSSLSINLNAIHANLLQLTKQMPMIAMVKGNGYGTDLVTLAKSIEHFSSARIPFLGVSHVEEGIQLRESGIQSPIFVLSAPPHTAESIIRYQLTPAINSFEEMQALIDLTQSKNVSLPVHLSLNTGMNRFGMSDREALALVHLIENSPTILLDGVMTHFAAAEDAQFDAFTHQQIRKFQQFVQALPNCPRWIHAANSAGAARFHLPFCTLARIGLAILGYGVGISEKEPALTLKTSLASILCCKKEESVGYNRSYVVKRESRIGTIPFGYYDGYPRSLSSKGYVIVRGKQAPIVGKICMDFTMIDLTDIPEAQVGDSVTLFDKQLSPELVASWCETDVREILVKLSPRVNREWAIPFISNHFMNSPAEEESPSVMNS